ncbi:hypothetical protein FRX31_007321 [Thalictrum thalictroides]|uniref:Uncharacterized protein n=1 Tax=Thalictrum thalictroides TaxID=46969 RepID=A0A7J6X3Z1_THATH|nr:hypothetical protein FRX31_007321 [Thalictrum thalictroides]
MPNDETWILINIVLCCPFFQILQLLEDQEYWLRIQKERQEFIKEINSKEPELYAKDSASSDNSIEKNIYKSIALPKGHTEL